MPKHCATGPSIPTAVSVTLFSPFHPLSLELLRGRRGLWVLLEGPWPRGCTCCCALTVPREPWTGVGYVSPCAPQQTQPALMPHHCAMEAGLQLSRKILWTFNLSPSVECCYPLASLLGRRAQHAALPPALPAFCTVTRALLCSVPFLCPSFLWDTWWDRQGAAPCSSGLSLWVVWGRAQCLSLPAPLCGYNRLGAGAAWMLPCPRHCKRGKKVREGNEAEMHPEARRAALVLGIALGASGQWVREGGQVPWKH